MRSDLPRFTRLWPRRLTLEPPSTKVQLADGGPKWKCRTLIWNLAQRQSGHMRAEALGGKRRGVCFYARKLSSLTSNVMDFTSSFPLSLRTVAPLQLELETCGRMYCFARVVRHRDGEGNSVFLLGFALSSPALSDVAPVSICLNPPMTDDEVVEVFLLCPWNHRIKTQGETEHWDRTTSSTTT